jgi:signal transduction histidine kinase
MQLVGKADADMKRFWNTYILLAVLVGLLTLFLGLQYNWLSQASEADRERIQKRVEADARNFANDFNREIQAAFFNFQTDPRMWVEGDYTEFSQRYDYWAERTAYPDLISEIVYIPALNTSVALAYSREARTFTAAEENERLDALRVQVAGGDLPPSYVKQAAALVMPIHKAEARLSHLTIRRTSIRQGSPVEIPRPDGFLAIFLDESVIRDRILPQLREKYFGGNDYAVEVRDVSGENIYAGGAVRGEPDVTAGVLDLTPDNLIFFAGREFMSPREDVPGEGNFILNQHIESHTFTRSGDANTAEKGSIRVEVHDSREGRPRAAVFAGTMAGEAPWQLRVQHTDGSVAAFVRNQRNKSLAVSGGIYILLLASIFAIVVSTDRAKRFAQRQVDFVSSVTHEFRTPLSVIYTAGENLADGVTKDGDKIEQYGELIKGEGRKLSSMVEQILEFAGARSGKKQYKFAPADLSQIAEDALRECSTLLESGEFDVETELSRPMLAITADADALTGAVQNLILNAVKYSNGTRWLRVATTNGAGTARLTVEDRGIGISSADLRKIFEPFYRAKDVVDAQIHGNGLGLSLVKEIVEDHGGRITAESEVGKGSRFTIEIPVSRTQST